MHEPFSSILMKPKSFFVRTKLSRRLSQRPPQLAFTKHYSSKWLTIPVTTNRRVSRSKNFRVNTSARRHSQSPQHQSLLCLLQNVHFSHLCFLGIILPKIDRFTRHYMSRSAIVLSRWNNLLSIANQAMGLLPNGKGSLLHWRTALLSRKDDLQSGGDDLRKSNRC